MRGLKENAVLGRAGWVHGAAWVIVSIWARQAYASEPRVLVLSESASQPAERAFFPALQIQLAGVAEPERVVAPPAHDTAERIRHATELVRARGALAAIWTERGRSPGPVILYAVGEREGRALVVVVSVPGDRGPELERTLGLKVRELVEELVRNRGSVDTALAAPPPSASPPAAASVPPTAAVPAGTVPPATVAQTPEVAAEPEVRWGGLAFAGVRLGSQPKIGLGRWGFSVGAGPELALEQLRFSAVLALDVFPEVTVEHEADRVQFSEIAVGGLLKAQGRAGPVWIGAQVGVAHSAVQAEGTSEGSSGQAAAGIWALILGVDAELPITPQLSLTADVQAQMAPSRIQLLVNGGKVVDLGNLRARLGISLVLRPFA